MALREDYVFICDRCDEREIRSSRTDQPRGWIRVVWATPVLMNPMEEPMGDVMLCRSCSKTVTDLILTSPSGVAPADTTEENP